MNFRQIEPAAKYSFHIAGFARLAARFFHVTAHAGIAFKIKIHVFLRIAAGDAQLARQSESRHAVHETEIDRFGRATLIGADGVRRDAKHFRSGGLMNVEILGERTQQGRIAGKVRHDAQLDLRIIGGNEGVARRRHECLANAPPLLSANGNVLQIRILRRQPSRGRHCLVIGRMDASGHGIDLQRQIVGVSGF